MPSLAFQVEGAQAVLHAASPMIALRLKITASPNDATIESVLLSCQVRIDAERRGYGGDEKRKLAEVFGEASLWSRSLRGVLWAHASVTVPRFDHEAAALLYLPCSADLSAAWTKYFYALEEGAVPLTLQFSGSVFYRSELGLSVAPIPWDREARYALDVRVYKEMIEHYYPGQVFLPIQADVFDRLYRYRMHRGLPTWEQTLLQLLGPETPS